MITGVVTQVYRNGDFDVWFEEQKFGSTCFRSHSDVPQKVVSGDVVACRFSPQGQGEIIAAVAVSAGTAGPVGHGQPPVMLGRG